MIGAAEKGSSYGPPGGGDQTGGETFDDVFYLFLQRHK